MIIVLSYFLLLFSSSYGYHKTSNFQIKSKSIQPSQRIQNYAKTVNDRKCFTIRSSTSQFQYDPKKIRNFSIIAHIGTLYY